MEGRGLHLKSDRLSMKQLSRREVAPSLGCWSVGKLGAITAKQSNGFFCCLFW